MTRLGIYRSAAPPGVFFDAPAEAALRTIVAGAVGLGPAGAALIDPPPGTAATRIGELVIAPAEDPDPYVVQAAAQPVGKPEVNRKPPGDPGSWAIQSLLFSRDQYTPAQARAWIRAQGDRYGDYGVDETGDKLHFRQYDPAWFSAMRVITLGDGITANYGRVAAERRKAADATAMLAAAGAVYQAHYDVMKSLNRLIIQAGVRIVDRSPDVAKADPPDGEERYVLSLVLEPNDGVDAPLRPDTQKDIYSAAEIRRGAHSWMEAGGAIDLMHNWQPLSREDVRPCESYLAPCDFTCGEGDRAQRVRKGSWMLALRIVNDDLWAAVKAERLGAYSIGGSAERTPVPAAGGPHGEP